jgi:hypothetical protein
MTNSERAYRNRVKKLQREMVNEYKQECGCKECGSQSELELHHIDPTTKVKDVATLISQSTSWTKLRTEILKCVVVCKSCHKKIHYGGK